MWIDGGGLLGFFSKFLDLGLLWVCDGFLYMGLPWVFAVDLVFCHGC